MFLSVGKGHVFSSNCPDQKALRRPRGEGPEFLSYCRRISGKVKDPKGPLLLKFHRDSAKVVPEASEVPKFCVNNPNAHH